jgi:hypothetical protein
LCAPQTEKSKAVKASVQLVEKAGKGHGWPDTEPDLEVTAVLFDEHLSDKKRE